MTLPTTIIPRPAQATRPTTAGDRLIGSGSALPARDVPGARLDDRRLVELTGHLAELRGEAGGGLEPGYAERRIGIRARRVLDAELDVVDLAEHAARQAIGESDPARIGLAVVSNSFSGAPQPAVSCELHARLGLPRTSIAFDLVQGCGTFVAALDTARSWLVRQAPGARALVVGAEVMSRVLDAEDPITAAVCGDGAGAWLIERPRDYAPAPCLHHTLSELGDSIRIAPSIGESPMWRFTARGGRALIEQDRGHRMVLSMAGRRVFKEMVEAVPRALTAWHELDGTPGTDRSGAGEPLTLWLHQANARMLNAIGERLSGGPLSGLLPSNIAEVGNTSSASIPLLFDDELRAGRVVPGEHVIAGFGAGCTIAVTRMPELALD